MVIHFRNVKQYFYQLFHDKSDLYFLKILGIVFACLGVFLLSYPNDVNNKIGVMLVLISIFIFLFFPEKRITNHYHAYIFLFLIIWLLFMTFITNSKNLDTFFFSVVLGMLIVKEFSNGYIAPPLKKRLSILTLVFFSLSMILVAEKVISIFNM